MRKFITSGTLFILVFFSNCIPFKENIFDPNSSLSLLYGLLLLNRSDTGSDNQGINYFVVDIEILDGSERFNGQEISRPFVRVTKLPESEDSGYPDSPVLETEFSTGEFIGTFWNSGDGLVRLYMKDAGKYRLDLYTDLVNRVHSGVYFLEVKPEFTLENLNVIGVTISGYATNFLKTYREIRQGDIYSLDWKDQFVASAGSFGGTNFFKSYFILNRDFYIDSTVVRSAYYPGIFYSIDGENWESIFLSEFKATLVLDSGGASIFSSNFGTATGTDQELFLLMNKYNGEINESDLASQHLVRIPISNPRSYTVQTITPQLGGYRIFTEYPIFTDGTRIVSGEILIGSSTVALFSSDLNLSSKLALTPPGGDSVNDFLDYSGTYPNPNPLRSVFMQDSNIYSVGLAINYGYINVSGSNGTSTYSSSDILFTANTSSVFGTRNFLFKDHDGSSPVRLAVLGALPIKIASPGTPLVFPTSTAQGPTFVKELGTTGLSQLQTLRKIQSSDNRALMEYDLTGSGYSTTRVMFTGGVGFQEVQTNTSKFRPLPSNYSEISVPSVASNNFGVADDKLLLAYIPIYSTPAGNRAENVIIMSKNLDGTSWTDWKILDFAPFIR
ncbi:hypothetical protein [Leptospira sp. GIMC2001]|uniref:hypothetical protein n=1 Tax=Leptospira sp. GIMC2001 TaxID=1513297 RepID=UPI002349F1ED|nr:hypothetical protein [Leptospira sp. GIMC2001]WCL50244.1 hypothetical protein O4O04_05330 [Leptospira sp. GIMC2001]